jgi:cobalamin biosynthesis protein CobT
VTSTAGYKLAQRASDLMRRILLQEVHSIDLHLRLVRPCPAKFERVTPDDRPGISYDEKFWNRALSHCVSTVLDNGCNVSRLAEA